jgi:hypothetical protein
MGGVRRAPKMKDCRWLKPVLVGQFEFREWTPDNHLRDSRFVALRDDKKPRDLKREQGSISHMNLHPDGLRAEGRRQFRVLEIHRHQAFG